MHLEEETAGNDRLNLWIAFDYGGRAEIVEAVKRVLANGADAAGLDEEVFARYLYAARSGPPHPDLG